MAFSTMSPGADAGVVRHIVVGDGSARAGEGGHGGDVQ